jgi:hypothetical protein
VCHNTPGWPAFLARLYRMGKQQWLACCERLARAGDLISHTYHTLRKGRVWRGVWRSLPMGLEGGPDLCLVGVWRGLEGGRDTPGTPSDLAPNPWGPPEGSPEGSQMALQRGSRQTPKGFQGGPEAASRRYHADSEMGTASKERAQFLRLPVWN